MRENTIKQHWVSLALAFILSVMAIISQPMAKLDSVWSDIMLTSEKAPVSQNYLIVDVTAEDAAKYGGLPLPRQVLAQTLTRLGDAGAERILLDMMLSDKLSSDKDAPLVAASSQLGMDRLAIPLNSDPKFNTAFVDIALLTDRDGWTRHVRTSNKALGYNPARWLATGELSGEAVDIDLRYDPASVKRMSLGSILDADNLDMSGHLVVISPNSAIVQSRVQLPLSKMSNRAVILAVGSQSVASGYQGAVKSSWLLTMTIALAFTALGVLIATRLQKPRLLFAAGFIMSFAVIGLNMFLIKLWGAPAYPILQYTCFLIGLIVSIGFRLRIFQMMSSFLKGDLSPEEALAWRAHEESEFPVILLNAMGTIRRKNAAAQSIDTMLGDDFGERCLAEFMQKSQTISVKDHGGTVRKLALERPNNAVPIIILKDVTETARQFDALEADRQRAVKRAETFEQKKIRAEETSQLKSNFLANMSHELRTPLNAINGFSDILQREMFGPLGDPRYKEFAKDINFSGEHLLSLINDILDLSKIEAGKMTLNTEILQVEKIMSQAVRMLKVRAEKSQLNLTYDGTPLPQIKADARAVKQVLLNLMTNAIKFTPEGGAVHVSTHADPTGLSISVSDSGVGISPEDIERLAQPFEQVVSKSKTQEGTGLGLALSKSLVELHGGTFLIQSMVGKGTRVTVTLPYNMPEHRTAAAA